jgi:lysozyme
LPRYYRFKPWMLNGHPGDVTLAVKRCIVRGVNHGLVVTSTTDGTHAPTSYHYTKPLGSAVDMGFNPGTDREAALQGMMVRRFRSKFWEEFGPQNDLWIKNGVQITAVEGTDLEQMHDTHIHMAPRALIPLPARPWIGATRASRKGLDFLVRQEGVRRWAYNDSQGHATFGVGHLIHLGPVTEEDRRRWGTPAHPKPMTFVLEVLRVDLRPREAAVRRATGASRVGKRRLHPHEFDACLSLCFNIGEGAFEQSSVARHIREGRGHGHFKAAALAFLMWDRPPELLPRRKREQALFLHGRY